MNPFEIYQNRINLFLETQLDKFIPNQSRLKEAMAYSLLSGGKRVRPILVYATANSIQLDLKIADYIAAANEMNHAYSLIHDDLPAMDNDDLRRGKPTNHIAFDEATAILAGDALQSLAFETLSQTPFKAELTLQLVSLLAKASGAIGMAGGQSLDLFSENKQISLTELKQIHALKTGALLSACVNLTVKSDIKVKNSDIKYFQSYAQNIGVAFQIIDDVLDVTQDTKTLGKPANSDTKNNKSTYPSLLGLESAQKQAEEHIVLAFKALQQVPYNTADLQQLTQWIFKRSH